MSSVASSSYKQLSANWKKEVDGLKGQLNKDLDLVHQKKMEIEDQLHLLVVDTSLDMTLRTRHITSLMKEQLEIKMFIDKLQEIIE